MPSTTEKSKINVKMCPLEQKEIVPIIPAYEQTPILVEEESPEVNQNTYSNQYMLKMDYSINGIDNWTTIWGKNKCQFISLEGKLQMD